MGNQRHFRASRWRGMLLPVFALSVISAAAGFSFAFKVADQNEQTLQRSQLAQLSTQAHLLVDQVWGAIETIRAQAVSLQQVRTAQAIPTAQPSGGILHWAELEADAAATGTYHAKQSATNPAWARSSQLTENFYLASIEKNIDLAELRENGVAILRIKQDPQRADEWLALIFRAPSPSKNLIVALIDPSQTFSVLFRAFRENSDSAARGYLIARDGQVLAHSQESYAGSSFAGAEVFGQAARKLFEKGIASFETREALRSLDRMPVMASFARQGGLPLAIGVEAVSSPRQLTWEEIIPGGLKLILALFGISALGAALFAFGRNKDPEDSLETQDAPDTQDTWITDGEPLEVNREALLVAPPDSFQDAPIRETPNLDIPKPGMLKPGNDAIALSPTDYALEAVTRKTSQETPPHSQPSFSESLPSMIYISEIPNAVSPDSSPGSVEKPIAPSLEAFLAAKRAREAEARLMAGFESEMSEAREPREVAEVLSKSASDLLKKPALFFTFHEGIRAAILQATAGFESERTPDGLSFSVSPALLERIREGEMARQIIALDDYAPLKTAVSAQIGSRSFGAWPVTGSLGRNSGRSRLLGFLVILEADHTTGISSLSEQGHAQRHALTELMRKTGIIYEKTLLSR